MTHSVGRITSSRRRFLVAATLAALAGSTAFTACRSVQTEDEIAAEAQEKTYLKVENRAFLDMTLYVVRSAQRIRLGTVTGNTTGRLLIPPSLVNGRGILQFMASPIGGNRSPVSQEISVSAGDEVLLIIPPS